MQDAVQLFKHLCDPDRNAMTVPRWSEKLDAWRRGEYPQCNATAYYETSGFVDPARDPCYEVFVPTDTLPTQQDPAAFSAHFAEQEQEDAAAFDNVSGDTRLVSPLPQPGRNFATMYHFCDQATHRHQQRFWQRAALEIDRWMLARPGQRVFVSTHGHGVPYFHLRISSTPKYYQTPWLRAPYDPPRLTEL